jgi:hypothetical protein
VNYDVLRARSKGRLPNLSRGGKNKKIVDKEDEEETLKLYYTRCILIGDPLERKHIKAATNSILHAVGKKSVSKP